MRYVSTRGQAPAVSASQAILAGIAPDGGLYVPEQWPQISLDWQELANQSYQEIAELILAAFLDDFTPMEIQSVVQAAYGAQWDSSKIVNLHQTGNLHYMELFHGPTLAFKDVALQALPHLLTTAAAKQGNHDKIVILTATSGDTGTAAMSGFGDVDQTEILVFYPEIGVSDIQRQQMQTEPAANAHVTAITGNFDDAQRAVKSLLGQKELHERLAQHQLRFSSANSINIGRLIPQIVYYIYAYAQLVKQGQIEAGQMVDIAVPTGNFGNILAAYYASQIGLPVNEFTVASNENNVLTDFFNTGRYDRRRDFKVTSAPAMDILVSSNLERLIYFASGQNSQEVAEYMQALDENGFYQLKGTTQANLSHFKAGYANEKQIKATIHNTFQQDDYLLDPHTAVGRFVIGQHSDLKRPTLLAATASPYKFPQAVLTALDQPDAGGQAGLVALATCTNSKIPAQIQSLFDQPILHKQVIEPDQIQATINQLLF
ncbi:threonine synthase [Convivina intestini]|uniref:threonine synthase n=1 Tax=Convivina intestini TaxID=1505726 RepID=UPI00200BC3C1|nr:threonine synthase [Convivina intestini]CAH1851979.1 Threonine synthase [Convivina intestini]